MNGNVLKVKFGIKAFLTFTNNSKLKYHIESSDLDHLLYCRFISRVFSSNFLERRIGHLLEPNSLDVGWYSSLFFGLQFVCF